MHLNITVRNYQIFLILIDLYKIFAFYVLPCYTKTIAESQNQMVLSDKKKGLIDYGLFSI